MTSFFKSKYISYFYLIALILATVIPINSGESSLNNNYTLNIRWDYLIHGLVYLPIPFLVRNVVQNIKATIAISILIALALESLQILIPFRAFNANDLLANEVGVLAGMVFVLSRGRVG
ncbi:MAG: VanZ family protein [Bacteroidales bacterium]|nr:VanZ family protein [Bacteroidales bacterium]